VSTITVNELRQHLENEYNGDMIIGFADMRILPAEARQNADDKTFDYGIIIGLPFSKEAMIENNQNLPQKYLAEHIPMNVILREKLRVAAANFLEDKGFDALTDTPATTFDKASLISQLPQKTVGTLSGIGWIGKCAMLVTKEFGSALRITVLLTNAPLECGTPITKSLCPQNCTACIGICPGKSVKNILWEVGIPREKFYDAHACSKAALTRAKELLDYDYQICGLCMSHCPFTKKALDYS